MIFHSYVSLPEGNLKHFTIFTLGYNSNWQCFFVLWDGLNRLGATVGGHLALKSIEAYFGNGARKCDKTHTLLGLICIPKYWATPISSRKLSNWVRDKGKSAGSPILDGWWSHVQPHFSVPNYMNGNFRTTIEVLSNIKPYFGDESPYIGLTCPYTW